VWICGGALCGNRSYRWELFTSNPFSIIENSMPPRKGGLQNMNENGMYGGNVEIIVIS
jgi:hypothetical protein